MRIINLKYFLTTMAAFGIFGILSCNKFLDAVPDKSLTVPTTLQDMTALLNNNLFTVDNNNPAVGEIGADDYYLDYSYYLRMTPVVRNCYTWQPDILQGTSSYDWDNVYKQIYYANIVLDNLSGIQANGNDPSLFDLVKGRALFYRAFAFYNLAQLFAKPYIPASAATDLGIPLRLNADLSAKSVRSSVKQTYDQIIQDLKQAKNLLPVTIPDNTPYIPSKAAAYALLSRVYLNMQDYPSALQFADSSLFINNALMDYNTINPSRSIIFPYPSNPEVLYQAYQSVYFYFTGPKVHVDTSLYASYEDNDLRKALFFATRASDGTKYFKGSYTGSYALFCGIATDEMYLTQAECYARLGDEVDAMSSLNELLAKRWKTGTFVPFSAASPDEALSIVLKERRKELVFREIRWSDLRRLNQDSRFAITLTRLLNGQTFSLPPNDPRYVYPIADDEIKLSGIQQNPR